jgi:hypothetical protein
MASEYQTGVVVPKASVDAAAVTRYAAMVMANILADGGLAINGKSP